MPPARQPRPSFEPSQVTAFRLARQRLLDSGRGDLASVTEDVCGIQAQVQSSAEMALWARLHHLNPANIRSALWESRSLIKTSCMRGTLHLLTPADLPVYISALKSNRLESLYSHILRNYGITREQDERAFAAVVGALSATPISRRELADRLVPTLGASLREHIERPWGVVRRAVVEGIACYGPDRGTESTFVRVDSWLTQMPDIPEDEAKQTLFRRYLGAYGPATLRDFSKWSGLAIKEIRDIPHALRDGLVEVSFDGNAAYLLRDDLDALANSRLDGTVLRLLGNFDPYLLAHADTDHYLDPVYYKRVYRKAGWISPVVLLNGRVVGIWSQTRSGSRLIVEVEPFEKLPKGTHTLIESEAAALASFLNTRCEVTFSPQP